MSPARCPHCESLDVLPKPGTDEASDGPLRTTHECQHCRTPFAYTPPSQEIEKMLRPVTVALLLLFAVPVFGASDVPRDSRGRIVRHRALVAAFMKANPCPEGPDQGSIHRCRGHKVDHVLPLCAGGPDDPGNMAWMRDEEAKVKDRLEVAICKRGWRFDK